MDSYESIPSESVDPTEVTQEDLEILKSEQDIFGEQDEKATAERLFREGLPLATLSIIRLSQSAQSDRTRLDAAKYVVERNLGRIQDLNTGVEDPLMDLLNELNAKELHRAD